MSVGRVEESVIGVCFIEVENNDDADAGVSWACAGRRGWSYVHWVHGYDYYVRMACGRWDGHVSSARALVLGLSDCLCPWSPLVVIKQRMPEFDHRLY